VKILQVTPFFSPVHGGSAESVYRLSRELTRRGHEVTVYTSDYKLDSHYIDSLPKVKIRVSKAYFDQAKFFVTPGMARQAKKEVSYFDVIHMNNYYTFQNIILHYYARQYDIPYVLQARGSAGTYFEKGTLKRIFDRLRGYRMLKDASRVIALTAMEVEQYKSMGVSEDKIEIVPNGVDLSEFDDLPQRGEFRRKYGLNDNQRIILYLGRIHKIKGLDLLAKSFAKLSKEVDNVKLVFVGPDGGYLPSLKKLVGELKISDKVLFTGPLYGEEKLEAYVDADVYVLPSFYETFPNTVLEACACETPVILTDRCGIADIINGQAGLVVPYDEEQLRQALLHLLGDDKLRQELGKKGKLLVRERFNWDKIVRQLEDVYMSCLPSV